MKDMKTFLFLWIFTLGTGICYYYGITVNNPVQGLWIVLIFGPALAWGMTMMIGRFIKLFHQHTKNLSRKFVHIATDCIAFYYALVTFGGLYAIFVNQPQFQKHFFDPFIFSMWLLTLAFTAFMIGFPLILHLRKHCSGENS